MPKLKTRKAFKKRFRITRNGKVLASRSFRRHLLADRSPKKKRQRRRVTEFTKSDARDAKTAMPYG